MKNQHFEAEIDGNLEAMIDDICGRSRSPKFDDDFGDTNWLDEFIEDFIGG